MHSKEQFNLTGKVAIITGSSKGIGKAIAKGLAEQGAQVVISSRNQEACDEVATAFNEEGLKAIGIACHIGKEDQRKNLVDKTIAAFGRIDILVNNAAINPVYGPIEEVSPEIFDKIMDVNVKAPWSLSNLVLPHFQANKNGSIINIASVEALTPGLGLGIYSTSKAAILMLTKNQAKEWGKFGVKANAICPGLIKTKFSAALWQNEKILSKVEKALPSSRMGLPKEMVGLACLLASDAGNYMTGGVYTADGGYMIAG
ncbi:SDR family NAD(P)-dependent oxidoreductase [Polaribacter dokdonensis]|uniref:NAD(P)-dependent dehydrogenase, short-chain alcohol dehydrogenase family n=1 Tax=Polaribacter dokdonensis DSW-5 TaxID=1300348 RepID=A0A0M9CG13_9FLAO|nr:glucose 1-dehydrogenase [Polaribacter dokdonensis]KOY51901.1 Short chain dehydrogenase [Polaribacter dokdonensis DSW-5]SEE00252.1 NAD(P)-dependent dehydrogenase, short-chain alcohol dehydrogenase family [Polaribacter dokdonensis DSW-5]